MSILCTNYIVCCFSDYQDRHTSDPDTLLKVSLILKCDDQIILRNFTRVLCLNIVYASYFL